MYAIKDEFTAFCFDRAVTRFGEAVQSAITEATADAKTRKSAHSKAGMVLNKWLGEQRFKDPAKR